MPEPGNTPTCFRFFCRKSKSDSSPKSDNKYNLPLSSSDRISDTGKPIDKKCFVKLRNALFSFKSSL